MTITETESEIERLCVCDVVRTAGGSTESSSQDDFIDS